LGRLGEKDVSCWFGRDGNAIGSGRDWSPGK